MQIYRSGMKYCQRRLPHQRIELNLPATKSKNNSSSHPLWTCLNNWLSSEQSWICLPIFNDFTSFGLTRVNSTLRFIVRGEGLRENGMNQITVSSDCVSTDRFFLSGLSSSVFWIVDIRIIFDESRTFFQEDVFKTQILNTRSGRLMKIICKSGLLGSEIFSRL
jgi:hypothetical protein